MTMAYENEITSTRSTSEELPTLPSMDQSEEHKVTTSDVIILGEDAYSTMEESLETVEVDIRLGFEKEAIALDDWLKFRVKNELVTQIFTGLRNEVQNPFEINISQVKEVLVSEMDAQVDQSNQMIDYLHATVPEAVRPNRKGRGSSTQYSYRDLGNLERRKELKTLAVDFIETIQQTGDDGLFELTENYISQTIEEARMEALTILAEQNKQLEAANLNLVEKVEELEEEVKIVRLELEDRDMQLLDSQLEDQLTTEAKDLAL